MSQYNQIMADIGNAMNTWYDIVNDLALINPQYAQCYKVTRDTLCHRAINLRGNLVPTGYINARNVLSDIHCE
jgi:hypothetical protein